MSKLGQKIWKAVKDGKLEELVQRLSGGVDPTALRYEEVYYGWMMTALTLASDKGDTAMVNLLAKAGADVNHRSYDGHTALMWASLKGHIATVQALLQWRAQLDQQNVDGYTALMKAAAGGHVEVVRLLLDWGADKRIQDKHWKKTAADMVKNKEIRALINSHVFSGKTPQNPAIIECAELERKCDTFMRRRDVLWSQYSAARAAKPVDYAHLSTLGESLGLKLESAEVILSEEDYLTLAALHTALVKKVKAKCDALLEAEQPDLLASLAAKLIKLQELPVHKLEHDLKGAKTAAEAALKPHDPAKLQRLQTECTTFIQQLAHAPARRGLMQRRDELAVHLKAAKAASYRDYILASKIMKEQQALKQESGKLPLSEEDYLTLAVRHAVLVQQVQGTCEDLVAARQYRLLRNLAAQLTALIALDLSVLQDPSEMDPVWVDEAAADPVHVAPGSETTYKSPAPSRSVPVDG